MTKNGKTTPRSTAANSGAVRVYDPDETNGYLDTTAFVAFTIIVKDAIDAIYIATERPAQIADIRRVLGDKNIPAWLWDSLDALCGIGTIKMTSEVTPIRFAPQILPVVKKRRSFNSTKPELFKGAI